ncbi:MAG: rhodanese-like domain-containing protein [Gammaproteobacteria bacterium]
MQQITTFILNHWELFLALVVILALLASTGLSHNLLGFKELQPPELTQMVNHQNAVVLDVREDKEFGEGHIVNAVHVPLSTLEVRLKTLEKFKGRPIITTCQTGDRSARAAALLRKHGFEPVYKLAGGLMAWRGAKLPLSTK